ALKNCCLRPGPLLYREELAPGEFQQAAARILWRALHGPHGVGGGVLRADAPRPDRAARAGGRQPAPAGRGRGAAADAGEVSRPAPPRSRAGRASHPPETGLCACVGICLPLRGREEVSIDELISAYRAAGQGQVFAFWDLLPSSERAALANQAAE